MESRIDHAALAAQLGELACSLRGLNPDHRALDLIQVRDSEDIRKAVALALAVLGSARSTAIVETMAGRHL